MRLVLFGGEVHVGGLYVAVLGRGGLGLGELAVELGAGLEHAGNARGDDWREGAAGDGDVDGEAGLEAEVGPPVLPLGQGLGDGLGGDGLEGGAALEEAAALAFFVVLFVVRGDVVRQGRLQRRDPRRFLFVVVVFSSSVLGVLRGDDDAGAFGRRGEHGEGFARAELDSVDGRHDAAGVHLARELLPLFRGFGAQQAREELVDLDLVRRRLQSADENVAEVSEIGVGVVVQNFGDDLGHLDVLRHRAQSAPHHVVQHGVQQRRVRRQFPRQLQASLGVEELVQRREPRLVPSCGPTRRRVPPTQPHRRLQRRVRRAALRQRLHRLPPRPQLRHRRLLLRRRRLLLLLLS
mmetsp:Transcript_27811/g.85309  ORF Transcript_27811/g.85309 Transcript_27811/m.85309 type:complete len:350 (+) Transcript_27811:1206-2255(+)